MARTKVFDEETVLTKAVNLFWCKGYNGTSAQDLVDELGISRSSLYDTYVDKRTLYIKSLNQYREQMAGARIKMLDSAADSEETIKEIFKYLAKEAISDKLSKGCFMVNSTIELAPHDKEVAEIINSNMRDIEDSLTRAIKKGQEAGQFKSDYSARSLARFLFNTISGLRVASRSGADKKVFDDIIKVTMSALK